MNRQKLAMTNHAMLALTLAATAIPALIASAIISPATAFAQNVSCTACTHEVSYFKGKGGLIAKADGTTEVTWVAQCGGVVRSGKLEANDDGIVSTLFDDDNNLACSTDDGRFRLGPVTDGGWFWITDDDNSAVGNLVNNDILGNAATTLANAGEGVETAAGKGVTFVKETATGRVGILPNVLPVAPTPPIRKCGFTGTPDVAQTTAGKTVISKNCKLGDGKAILRLTGPVGPGGATAPLANNTIARPYSGEIRVGIGLYGNGTGHYLKPGSTSTDPDIGWVGGSPYRAATSVYAVRPGPGRAALLPEQATAIGTTYGVVEITSSTGALSIGRAGSAGTYCGTPDSPKNIPLELLIFSTDTNQTVIPAVASPNTTFPDGNDYPSSAQTTLKIVCPSSVSAQESVELVLENPSAIEQPTR